MDPTVEYLNVAADCVRAVASREGHDAEVVERDPSVSGYMAWAAALSDETDAAESPQRGGADG